MIKPASIRVTHLFGILILVILFISGCRKGNSPIELTETIIDFGQGTGTTTWTKNNIYVLEGFVFVNEGQVLTIEPGTVIQGKTGQGDKASALIVARGGKIIAEGTAQNPIIFTVEGDDLEGSIPVHSKGLWGGLIILGRAHLNLVEEETHIEGIPISEPRGLYGGTLDDDNSGVLSYISIRHGGTDIGSGNEINGLTLGGVGSGTQIDHIEIISNQDDGIELFGGSVNLKYIAVAYCGDDAFDIDQGYHGKAQFILAIQSPETGDKLIEITGGEGPGYGLPYTIPEIYNFTGIGRGFNTGSNTISISSNGGGKIFNSVFTDQDLGVFIEYTEAPQDSYKQIDRDNLILGNNVFWDIAENDSLEIFKIFALEGIDTSDPDEFLLSYFDVMKHEVKDYGIGCILCVGDPLSIKPNSGDFSNMAPYPSEWFNQVNYKGAFYDHNWLLGWSLLDTENLVIY